MLLINASTRASLLLLALSAGLLGLLLLLELLES
jgi:hypothetical protein